MERTPIFLFSLPRSGSTLLQRILGSHSEIVSAAEPWILLPIFQALHPRSSVAEQGHEIQSEAITDFIDHMSGKQGAFRSAVAQFAQTLYDDVDATKEARYFLDKTPRYTLICDEILNTFPKARFITLVRHPLAIASSIFSTWNKDYWNPAKHHIDFYTGMDKLTAVLEAHPERILKMRYEALVAEPKQEVCRICRFLEIDFEPSMLADLAAMQFEGRMGDQTGVHKYRGISQASTSSWQQHCKGFIRKSWLRRWINRIGPDRLSTLGYDFEDINSEINSLPNFYWGLPRDFASKVVWTSGLALQSIALRGNIGSESSLKDQQWLR